MSDKIRVVITIETVLTSEQAEGVLAKMRASVEAAGGRMTVADGPAEVTPETAARLLGRFAGSSAGVQDVVCKMMDVLRDPDTDEDERHAAVATIQNALFLPAPAEPEGEAAS